MRTWSQLVLTFQPVIANANNVVAPTSSQSAEHTAPISLAQSEESIAPASLAAIGVFVASILVCWMADRLLIYSTRYSGAELSKKTYPSIRIYLTHLVSSIN